LRNGMKNGFSKSPMGLLRREYTEEHDRENSLLLRATILASKTELKESEIQDRGLHLDPDVKTPRFALEKGFAIRTERTVMELQSLLTRAKDLIVERSSCFLVDPHQTLLTVLKGASDLNEMTGAWMALSKRVGLAQRNFSKYE
ncbi:hypothetical protein DFH09DRAFT_879097, partial [Mycena vulgaris]